MKTVNRETLKNYFRDGQMPSQRHFEALIDSMLNMNDEGFRKTVEHGEQLYAPIGHDALMSFFRDQQPDAALWQLRLGTVNDQLQFHAADTPSAPGVPGAAGAARADAAVDGARVPVMTLDASRKVGLGTLEPCARLDVRGVAASSATSRRVSPFSRAVFLIRSVVARKLLRPISPISGKGSSSG